MFQAAASELQTPFFVFFFASCTCVRFDTRSGPSFFFIAFVAEGLEIRTINKHARVDLCSLLLFPFRHDAEPSLFHRERAFFSSSIHKNTHENTHKAYMCVTFQSKPRAGLLQYQPRAALNKKQTPGANNNTKNNR